MPAEELVSPPPAVSECLAGLIPQTTDLRLSRLPHCFRCASCLDVTFILSLSSGETDNKQDRTHFSRLNGIDTHRKP